MIVLRPHNTRGNVKADWIDSYRTFSFPSYYDARYSNFGDLKTINDDRVQPGGHVPNHLHRNMEIFGYVVEGMCRHTDSFGKSVDIPAGTVQRMSCGTGITHTEGNSSDTPNRYLQLWIRPNILETEPIHECYHFSYEDKLNNFCEITEKLPIKQDAKLFCGIFTEDYYYTIQSSRKYYIYVVSGTLTINENNLVEGDGLSFEDEESIDIKSPIDSEIILFDLKK